MCAIAEGAGRPLLHMSSMSVRISFGLIEGATIDDYPSRWSAL